MVRSEEMASVGTGRAVPGGPALLILHGDQVLIAKSGDDEPQAVAPADLLAGLDLSAAPGTASGAPVGESGVELTLPVSLLLRDRRAFAWPEGAGGWTGLDRAALAALLHAPGARTGDEVAARCGRFGLGRGTVLAALERLAALGLVRLGPPAGSPSFIARARAAGPRGLFRAARRRIASKLGPGGAPPKPATPADAAIEQQWARPRPDLPPLGSGRRTPVFGLHCGSEWTPMSLALGMIFAAARGADGGRLNARYDLTPLDFAFDGRPTLDGLAEADGPAIIFASDYVWSIDANLEVSARAKAIDARTIIVHGGPSAPKYAHDAEAFLTDHPQVDVLVRGEGEATAVDILRSLPPDAHAGDLEALAGVPGLTFRRRRDGAKDGFVRTPDRPRVDDVDDLPSPYLSGEFDHLDLAYAVVETNRGCPYGCAYCDWGAATLSMVRRFDYQRVCAELEWLARRGVGTVVIADANFGMLPRDADIARHLAELRRRYGKPDNVFCAFAKNKTKYTREIVRTWVEAGMCTEGSLALQTIDPVVLANVRRSNIKAEKYDELADEFRRLRLSIVTDIMMGLPGATVESLKVDLQRCLDEEVTGHVFETFVLPNSPMNDPAYRLEFALQIEGRDSMLVATSSYSRQDYDEMLRLRLLYRAMEHFGLLRHVLRYLRRVHGLRELDILHDIDRTTRSEADAFPLLAYVNLCFDVFMLPPVSWTAFYDEVDRWIAYRYGIDDSALDTVFAVQRAVLPAPGRRFPDQVALDHDYPAWDRAWREAKAGRDEPPRPLSEYPPAVLSVEDPNRVCGSAFGPVPMVTGRHRTHSNYFLIGGDWELSSALTRPMLSTAGFVRSPVAA